MDEKMTVREACRKRLPLGGVDAEALEHGMTQLEGENKKLRKMYDDLVFKVQLMNQEHPAACIETTLLLKKKLGEYSDVLVEIMELHDVRSDEAAGMARRVLTGYPPKCPFPNHCYNHDKEDHGGHRTCCGCGDRRP